MNYYEELGVSQEATGEEIRKAHRRLVKLMHPDAQLDQHLKSLAETQMRRLNSIVSTLLDPDQRRAYDYQLRAESSPQSGSYGRPAWQGIPWWLASATGAVLFTLIAVWLWADNLSAGFGKRDRTPYVRPIDPPAVASVVKPPATVTAPDTTPAPTTSAAPVITPLPDPPHTEIIQGSDSRSLAPVNVPVYRQDLPAHLTAPARVASPPAPKLAAVKADPPKKIFNLPPSALVAQARPKDLHASNQLPPPPGVSAMNQPRDDGGLVASGTALPMATAPKPKIEILNGTSTVSRTGAGFKPRDPLEGEWIYAPKEPERRKAGFYPPEFIELKLFSNGDDGDLRGQYNARYVITDKPISPEVSFEVASVEKEPHKFVWQGSNGSRGTIAIHPVDDHTIRIEWRTTTSARGPALTSGAATLVRRP